MSNARISLAKSESDWVEWALSGMADNYSDAEEKAYAEDISVIEAAKQIEYFSKLEYEEGMKYLDFPLPANAEVVSDLLYYLEESAPSVAESETGSGQKIAALVRAAQNAAAKIRQGVPDALNLNTLERNE